MFGKIESDHTKTDSKHPKLATVIVYGDEWSTVSRTHHWRCEYCRSFNEDTRFHCTQCGGPREVLV